MAELVQSEQKTPTPLKLESIIKPSCDIDHETLVCALKSEYSTAIGEPTFIKEHSVTSPADATEFNRILKVIDLASPACGHLVTARNTAKEKTRAIQSHLLLSFSIKLNIRNASRPAIFESKSRDGV